MIAHFRALCREAQSEKQMRTGLALLAAVIAFGAVEEWVVLRPTPIVPLWPLALTLAVNLVTLLSLVVKRHSSPTRYRVLYLLNAAATAFALYSIYRWFHRAHENWMPFQGTKGALIVLAALAPSLPAALTGILFLAGSSTFLILSYPAEVRALLHPVEPAAVLGFAAVAMGIAIYRARLRELEVEAARAHAEAESIRRLAEAFLGIRDRMNTPLQAIRLGARLLQNQQTGEAERATLLTSLEHACDQLARLSQQLKDRELL